MIPVVKGFVRNGRYRHRNSLDLDILVKAIAYTGPKYTKMKVLFINRTSSDLVISHAPSVVAVQHEHLQNWARIE